MTTTIIAPIASMPAPLPPTIHANALLWRGRGLLILGRSQAGKTRLTLDLIEEVAAHTATHPAAMLIADDRVHLTISDAATGTLMAECPPRIAGLIACRERGIMQQPSLPEAIITHLILLSPISRAKTLTLTLEHLPDEPQRRALQSALMALPTLTFAAYNGALPPVLQWLAEPPHEPAALPPK